LFQETFSGQCAVRKCLPMLVQYEMLQVEYLKYEIFNAYYIEIFAS